MIWDLVIIGGGPVGSFAGYLAGNHNLKTLIVEEHNKIGEPLHCLGKLSVHAFEEFPLPHEPIRSNLKGGYFFFPNGNFIKLKKANPDSYILDRSLFDIMLAKMAEKNGCTFLMSAKAIGIEKENNKTKLIVEEKGKRKEIETRVIINAEGAKRQFAKKLGLRINPYLVSLQYEVTGLELLDNECVEVYLGLEYSKGFFLWISPYGDMAKIGVAVKPSENPKIYLDKFINTHKKTRNLKPEILRTYGGIIPILGPYEEYLYPNIIIIGDAAGYNKSTTGGGIYFGLYGAQIAIEQVKKYLKDSNINHLKVFPKLTYKKFGKELKFTKIARKFLDQLSDENLNEIYKIINSEEIIRTIENFGDTAYQTSILKIVPKLLKNKDFYRVLKLTPKLLDSLF